ncbi:MAG: hypothetical protein JST02_02435 [Bacteroidetes bacterium]|nr:hypothetical protein [Bacteroidota bacterium]
MHPVKSDTTKPKYGYDILEVLQETTSKLNLASIKNGTDSFEFRFWLPAKDLQTINILAIKYTDGKWLSTLTSFLPTLPEHNFKRNDTTNYFRQQTITNITTKPITPNIDIQLIVKKLAEFDFQNAPTNAEIELGQAISSGDTRYMLEFADKQNYRVIHYLNASRNSNKISFDDNFIKFIDLIKRHYGIEIG